MNYLPFLKYFEIFEYDYTLKFKIFEENVVFFIRTPPKTMMGTQI